MTGHDARTVLLLAVADDELVSGHRASYWTGAAPSIEEDLAFATIAQDEINHADVWYQVLLGGPDRDAVDRVALGREPHEYRHAVLCEREPRDFGYSLVRQWCYDHFDTVRLGVLAESSDADVAAVAAKLLHEERYHLEHGDHWVRRLAAGGDESRQRLAAALTAALPDALWLFEPLPEEDHLVASGLMPAYTAAQLLSWLERIVGFLDAADLGDVLPPELGPSDDGWVLPQGFFGQPGGRHGVHTPEFTDDVWPTMTELHRSHAGARW